MTACQPPKPGPDAFHKQRSKCLDAFVSCEEAVITLLQASNTKFGGEPFGSKVDALRKAKKSPGYSGERKQAVNRLLDQFEELLEQRNDLVHSRLQIATIGDVQKACFINAKHASTGAQTALLFSLESLRDLTSKASDLASELRRA